MVSLILIPWKRIFQKNGLLKVPLKEGRVLSKAFPPLVVNNSENTEQSCRNFFALLLPSYKKSRRLTRSVVFLKVLIHNSRISASPCCDDNRRMNRSHAYSFIYHLGRFYGRHIRCTHFQQSSRLDSLNEGKSKAKVLFYKSDGQIAKLFREIERRYGN